MEHDAVLLNKSARTAPMSLCSQVPIKRDLIMTILSM